MYYLVILSRANAILCRRKTANVEKCNKLENDGPVETRNPSTNSRYTQTRKQGRSSPLYFHTGSFIAFLIHLRRHRLIIFDDFVYIDQFAQFLAELLPASQHASGCGSYCWRNFTESSETFRKPFQMLVYILQSRFT